MEDDKLLRGVVLQPVEECESDKAEVIKIENPVLASLLADRLEHGMAALHLRTRDPTAIANERPQLRFCANNVTLPELSRRTAHR